MAFDPNIAQQEIDDFNAEQWEMGAENFEASQSFGADFDDDIDEGNQGEDTDPYTGASENW